MARRLETSSDDWHKFNEKADKIQRKHSAARTSDEREKWKRKAEELIDYMSCRKLTKGKPSDISVSVIMMTNGNILIRHLSLIKET